MRRWNSNSQLRTPSTKNLVITKREATSVFYNTRNCYHAFRGCGFVFERQTESTGLSSPSKEKQKQKWSIKQTLLQQRQKHLWLVATAFFEKKDYGNRKSTQDWKQMTKEVTKKHSRQNPIPSLLSPSFFCDRAVWFLHDRNWAFGQPVSSGRFHGPDGRGNACVGGEAGPGGCFVVEEVFKQVEEAHIGVGQLAAHLFF